MYDLSNFSSETLTQQLNLPASVTGGVLIEQVQSGMPAATAGLKQGDVITKVGDTTINSGTDLQVALFKYNIGDTITITYYRDGKQHTASVKLNKQQSDLSNSLTSGDNSSSDNSSNSDNSANSIFGGN
jgi:serine protease Do